MGPTLLNKSPECIPLPPWRATWARFEFAGVHHEYKPDVLVQVLLDALIMSSAGERQA